jgi:hypothetical protein
VTCHAATVRRRPSGTVSRGAGVKP